MRDTVETIEKATTSRVPRYYSVKQSGVQNEEPKANSNLYSTPLMYTTTEQQLPQDENGNFQSGVQLFQNPPTAHGFVQEEKKEDVSPDETMGEAACFSLSATMYEETSTSATLQVEENTVMEEASEQEGNGFQNNEKNLENRNQFFNNEDSNRNQQGSYMNREFEKEKEIIQERRATTSNEKKLIEKKTVAIVKPIVASGKVQQQGLILSQYVTQVVFPPIQPEPSYIDYFKQKPILNFEKSKLEDLAHEYKGNGTIRENILQLSKTYKMLIKARGDGNCFYRSFGYLFCKYFLDHKPEAFLEIIETKINDSFPFERFSHETEEYFKKKLLAFIQGMQDSNIFELLLNNDHATDENLVTVMRLLTTIGFVDHKEDFAMFFGIQDKEFETLLQKTMKQGEEAEELQIHALCRALQSMNWKHHVELFVKQISRNSFEIIHYEPYAVSSLNVSNGDKLEFVLFFRPGHYDILEKEMDEKWEQETRAIVDKETTALLQQNEVRETAQKKKATFPPPSNSSTNFYVPYSSHLNYTHCIKNLKLIHYVSQFGDAVIQSNIRKLSQEFSTLLQSKADGNSFYRCIGYLVCRYRIDYAPFGFSQTLWDKCHEFPFHRFLSRKVYLQNTISNLCHALEHKTTNENLCQRLQSNEKAADDMVVYVMRMLTVIGLVQNKELLKTCFGVQSDQIYDDCIEQAMTLRTEATAIHIHALCCALQSMRCDLQLAIYKAESGGNEMLSISAVSMNPRMHFVLLSCCNDSHFSILQK